MYVLQGFGLRWRSCTFISTNPEKAMFNEDIRSFFPRWIKIAVENDKAACAAYQKICKSANISRLKAWLLLPDIPSNMAIIQFNLCTHLCIKDLQFNFLLFLYMHKLSKEYPGLLRQSLKFREMASSHSKKCFSSPKIPFMFGSITQRRRHK